MEFDTIRENGNGSRDSSSLGQTLFIFITLQNEFENIQSQSLEFAYPGLIGMFSLGGRDLTNDKADVQEARARQTRIVNNESQFVIKERITREVLQLRFSLLRLHGKGGIVKCPRNNKTYSLDEQQQQQQQRQG